MSRTTVYLKSGQAIEIDHPAPPEFPGGDVVFFVRDDDGEVLIKMPEIVALATSSALSIQTKDALGFKTPAQ